MRQIPSLVSLCVRAVAMGIIDDGHFEDVFELPDELLDSLMMNLPPLALQGLHEQYVCSGRAFYSRSINIGNKRQRHEGFDAVWRALFKERWPESFKTVELINKVDDAETHSSVDDENDWQQLYWETHLQNCLDEAAERAMLPSFDGHIGELPISEISGLLVTSKLRALVFRSIKCESHVDGVCDLLRQNKDTLKSLEFVHCRFSSSSFSQICSCIFSDAEPHGIKAFSIKSSCVTDRKKSSLPADFVSFLSSGRSLESIHLSDTNIGPKCAKWILDTLLKSSLNLITLEISDNDIRGWLSKVDGRSGECSSLLGPKLSLKSLSILNLRGCNLCQDDAEDLNYVLIHMPNLTSLDLSDNPLEDEGITSLIPYFVKAFEKTPPLSDVNLQNCNLSCKGVTEFLESSQTLRGPLNTLSVAENNLSSSVAAPLAIFLDSPGVKALNIEAIGLEPLGFQELEKKMPKDVPLVRINISKNRGGSDCASFISKLIMQAPDLVVVDAGYNFILPEALMSVHDALNHSTRKLRRLDLTGNIHLSHSVHASKLLKYHVHGKPIVIIPSSLPSSVPYDDDP